VGIRHGKAFRTTSPQRRGPTSASPGRESPGRSASTRPSPRISTSCACGGGCPRCAASHSAQDVALTPGEPLPVRTRQELARRFRHGDFGAVRIHHDAAAAASARSLQTIAYTVGQHIVFGEGHYSPEDPAGRTLLAHELAHTLQQRSAAMADLPALGGRDDRLEAEADRIAAQALSGNPSRQPLSRLSVQRLQRATGSPPARLRTRCNLIRVSKEKSSPTATASMFRTVA
jgi:hypothetical protein